MTTTPADEIIIVALPPSATLPHRDRFELVAEKTLTLVLPEDDGLLRAFLAHELVHLGEAETLVQWGPQFTAQEHTLLALKPNHPADVESIIQEAGNRGNGGGGGDKVYVSPNAAVGRMQFELLFGDNNASASEEEEAKTTTTNATSISTRMREAAKSFKPRALPATVRSQPKIQPRLSKAAALRMGVAISPPPRSLVKPKQDPNVQVGISGLPKQPVATPFAVSAPKIQPRLSKAAALRMGVPLTPPATRAVLHPSTAPNMHRRTLTLPASLKPPVIVPRQNRASLARTNPAPNEVRRANKEEKTDGVREGVRGERGGEGRKGGAEEGGRFLLHPWP